MSHWQPIALEEVPGLRPADRTAYVFLLEDPRPGILRSSSKVVADELIQRVSGDGALCLRKDRRGKPYVPNGTLHVSVSHSGSCLVIALATAEIGVDIEYLRPSCRWREIYRWINEPTDCLASPTEHDFLECWTAKESLLKLLHGGFDYGVQKVSVPRFTSLAFRRVTVGGRNYFLKPLPAWKEMTSCTAMTRLDLVQTFHITEFPERLLNG